MMARSVKGRDKRRAEVAATRRTFKIALSVAGVVMLGPVFGLLASEAPAGAVRDGEMTDAEARRGQILFLQCRACHSTDPGGGHLVGPNLAGLIGATAGRKDGFAYSEALASSSVTWSAETLNEYLADPDAFLPGTKMAFPGVASDADRRLLIRWLGASTRD